MASERITTKPFTGYAKCQRNQRTNSSAAATAVASSIITSLDMSIFTFHRRLVRCFSRLFRASTDCRRALFVVKRPGVNEFLERISQNYKVVVFTAGMTEYASQVLDRLDRKHVISHRLYRDSCKEVKGKYVKDLSLVEEKDLGNVLIVDDSPSSYSLQPENGVPIRPFVDDMKDQELMKLAEFFESCHYYEDMRDAVNEFKANPLI